MKHNSYPAGEIDKITERLSFNMRQFLVELKDQAEYRMPAGNLLLNSEATFSDCVRLVKIIDDYANYIRTGEVPDWEDLK